MNPVFAEKQKNIYFRLKYPVFLLLSFASILSSSSNPLLATQNNGYYVYQTSGIIGDQDIFVTANGIKIINKSSGLITISKAPTWNVSTYHNKTKSICTEPLSKFSGYIPEVEFVQTGQKWSKLPLVKSKNNIIAGINSTVYTTPGSFTKKQIKDWSRQFADSKFIKSARYCIASNLNIKPRARNLLCKFYGLKDLGGIPLEFKYHDLGGHLHVGLTTSSQKLLDKEALDFQIPSGFKKVKTHTELLSIARSTKKKEKKRRPLL